MIIVVQLEGHLNLVMSLLRIGLRPIVVYGSATTKILLGQAAFFCILLTLLTLI